MQHFGELGALGAQPGEKGRGVSMLRKPVPGVKLGSSAAVMSCPALVLGDKPFERS